VSGQGLRKAAARRVKFCRQPGKAFLAGGASSGKSSIAQLLVESWSPRRLYAATLALHAGDGESLARAERHREARGAGWTTAECQGDLCAVLDGVASGTAVLVDSVGPWIAGMLCGSYPCGTLDEDRARGKVEAFAAAFASFKGPCCVVSDEAGMGLVPPDPLSRRFRNLLGYANRLLAASARDAYLVSCGMALLLKGRPLALQALLARGLPSAQKF